MKKLRFIAASILRGVLLLLPGLAFAALEWCKAETYIIILAAIGLEGIFLCIYSFLSLAVATAKERRKIAADNSSEE